MDLRLRLLGARSEDEFKQLMWEHMRELADEQCDGNAGRKLSGDSVLERDDEVATIVSAVIHWLVLVGLQFTGPHHCRHYHQCIIVIMNKQPKLSSALQ